MRSRRESKGRRRFRWDRLFVILGLLLMIVVSFAGASMYAYYTALTSKSAPAAVAADTGGTPASAPEVFSKRINILLMGIDDGEADVPGQSSHRTDTLMVVSLNPEDGTMNLLSIPRDTRVNIPGRNGLDKIAHAYSYGGKELAVETVKNFLGIPVNYYLAVNWQAFIKVIDILGGVDLYVENNMNYSDPYANLEIHLQKGYQHLDGEKSGQYIRFRHDELGDIGRVQRQQRFLKALSNEMLQMGTIIKLPAIAATLNQYVETDMNAVAMLKLANSLKSFKTGSLQTEMLPGNFATIDGLSYWVPNQEQTRKLVERMFTAAAQNAGNTNPYHMAQTEVGK